jgi:hypothetical protein
LQRAHKHSCLIPSALLQGQHGLVRDRRRFDFKYWGYDSESKKFRIIFFSNNGSFTEEGNRSEGVVSEDKLTFEGPARFQYTLNPDGKVKINADGTLTVSWWMRERRPRRDRWGLGRPNQRRDRWSRGDGRGRFGKY